MKKLLLTFAIASFFFSGCKKGNEIKRKKIQYPTDTVAFIKMKQTWYNLKDGYSITFDSVLFDARNMTGATSGWAKAKFRFNDGISYSFFLLSPPSHFYYDTIIGHYKIYFNQLLPDPTVGDSIPNNPDEYVAKLEIMQPYYQ